MNTTATNPAPTTATDTTPAPAAPKVARKSRNKAKVPAPATVEDVSTVTARNELHAKVKDMLTDAAKRPAHEAHAILTSAVDLVRQAVPDAKLSDNKEQRAAQLVHLRTLRAAMGTQTLARMIGDAIGSLPGAVESNRFRTSTLSNGDLSAVNTRTVKVKTSSGRKGYSIR